MTTGRVRRISSADGSYTLTPPIGFLPVTRHLSFCLTQFLVRLPLTPNHITGLSLAAGLLGAWCFAAGSWAWAIVGGLLLILCYTLDNCDGEIARLKQLSSEWGARFDDIADWLVDSAFFACLGYGTWATSGEIIWFWLGLAATGGATIDFVIDVYLYAKAKNDPQAKSREEEATDVREPQDTLDWLIYFFHKLSRTDFGVIVFGLALFNTVWILVPLGAVGAQAFWVADLFPRVRGWHT